MCMLFSVLRKKLYNSTFSSNSKKFKTISLSEQLIETVSNNANDVATTVKNGIKKIDLQQAEKGKLKTSAFKWNIYGTLC